MRFGRIGSFAPCDDIAGRRVERTLAGDEDEADDANSADASVHPPTALSLALNASAKVRVQDRCYLGARRADRGRPRTRRVKVRRHVRFGFAGAAAAAALLLAAGCGGGGGASSSAAASKEISAPTCPKAWRVGWQKLANQIHAPVYCPSWLPQPLDGRFDGVFNGQTVDKDRSYLIKFLWFDSGLPSGSGPNEVHVVLRGQPGNAKFPLCDDSTLEGGKVVHHFSPCFSDPKGTKRFGRKVATLYTSNQGADQWHLLYAWRENGSLYTLSEHVAQPYTYDDVRANLDRMMRSLVRIEPSKSTQT
jgi:hypothetical protein